jgi:surfeit locus 1 family protein
VNLPDTHAPADKVAAQRNSTRRWALLLLTLIGITATLALGTWQLRRAAFKEALRNQIEVKNKLPAIESIAQAATRNIANDISASSSVAADSAKPLLYRNVKLRGQWLTQHTVFLDNRFMDGRAGFYMLTPLQLEASQAVVWVQRGWLSRNAQDRTVLPEVPTPAGDVQVPGRVIESVSRAYALGESDAKAPAVVSSAPVATRASRIWQNLPNIDFGAQAQVLPIAVLQTAQATVVSTATLSAESAAQDGLLRDWPQPDAGVAKHYGYAFQWFALCGLIIALYVWFQILAPRRRKP